MAAMNYEDLGERPLGGTLAAAMNWAGAFLSVLLIAGLATWGWKLWVRDVTGVPVVRALEGPMRVAPADPGGKTSEYQGLAVNRIAAEKLDKSVDKLVLAPKPTGLTSEDLPMAELAPPPAPEGLPSVETAPPAGSGTERLLAVAPADGGAEPVAAGPDTSMATADAKDVAPAPVPGQREPSATDLAVAAALSEANLLVPAQDALGVKAAPGVPRMSPRPVARPEGLQQVRLVKATGIASGEIDPATIPSGTRLVQLGAFASADTARTEWDRVEARFGDYMVGKERVVQEAQTGGRTFWRLRALGFDNLDDARQFCAVLVGDGANCIPVVQE